MPSPTNVQPLHGGNDESEGSERLGQAIQLVQARISEEMQISERISTKGRQLFALLSAFFAVAQTLTFGGFGITQITGPPKIVAVALGAFGVAALLVCGHRLADLETLRREAFVKPDSLLQWAREGNDRSFAQQALLHMVDVANKRRYGNERRDEKYKRLELSTRVALVLIAAQILSALIFRA